MNKEDLLGEIKINDFSNNTIEINNIENNMSQLSECKRILIVLLILFIQSLLIGVVVYFIIYNLIEKNRIENFADDF